MRISDEMRKELFSQLDEWATLSDEKIVALFSEKSIETINALATELMDGTQTQRVLTAQIFPTLVSQLREIKRVWSRKLGDAILAAQERADDGDISAAIEILQEFKESCPAPFYRGIAQRQIEYYTHGEE